MISHDDVRRIADLARIEVTAEEVDAVHGKLAAIFGLIDELAAVDTTGIEPMATCSTLSAAARGCGVRGGPARALPVRCPVRRGRPVPGAKVIE